jgi:ketosteroid isomerase-like protein
MNAQIDHAKAAMTAVMDQWTTAFLAKDVKTLRSLWDDKYDGLVYQAEEFATPLVSWLHIKHYYRDILSKVIEKVEKFKRTGLWIDVFGDVGFVYMISDFTMRIKNVPEPYNGSVRQTFVMRQVNGSWKIVHYHESLQTMATPEELQLDQPDPV